MVVERIYKDYLTIRKCVDCANVTYYVVVDNGFTDMAKIKRYTFKTIEKARAKANKILSQM